jgi:hypothetical protein
LRSPSLPSFGLLWLHVSFRCHHAVPSFDSSGHVRPSGGRQSGSQGMWIDVLAYSQTASEMP